MGITAPRALSLRSWGSDLGPQSHKANIVRQSHFPGEFSAFWWRPVSLGFLFGATAPQSQPLLSLQHRFLGLICYTGVNVHWNPAQPAPGIYLTSLISRCLQVPWVRKPTHTVEWNAIQPTTATVTSLPSVPKSLRSPEALNLRTQFIKNAPAWDGSNVENHRIGGTQ